MTEKVNIQTVIVNTLAGKVNMPKGKIINMAGKENIDIRSAL